MRAYSSTYGIKYNKGQKIWEKKLSGLNDLIFFYDTNNAFELEKTSQFLLKGEEKKAEKSVLTLFTGDYLRAFDKDGNKEWEYKTDSTEYFNSPVSIFDEIICVITDHPVERHSKYVSIDKSTGDTSIQILQEFENGMDWMKTIYIEEFQNERMIIGKADDCKFLKDHKKCKHKIMIFKAEKSSKSKIKETITFDWNSKDEALSFIKVFKLDDKHVLISSEISKSIKTGENSYTNHKTGEWLLLIDETGEKVGETILSKKDDNQFIMIKNQVYRLSETNMNSSGKIIVEPVNFK